MKVAGTHTLLLAIAAAAWAQPNSDATYKGLRNASVSEAFVAENIVLHRDNGVLTLKSGAIGFTPKVGDRDTVAVFVGEGSFTFEPAHPIEKALVRGRIGQDHVDESFDHVVLYFTDQTGAEIRGQAKTHVQEPRLDETLRDFHKRLRSRLENPRSMTEALVTSDTMDNLDADLLADLYNPAQPGFFSAYMHAHKRGDLRFLVRPRGSITELMSPEEVAIINVDPGAEHEGLWYLTHFANEFRSGQANSDEDHRSVEAVQYRVETTIGHNDHLAGATTLGYRALSADRVIKFSLLSNLRVSRVTLAGTEIPFIQEDRHEDGTFYAFLPQPMKRGDSYELAVEYQGDKVVRKEGSGVFSVGARESWYPSVNTFHDHALYELTFHVPKNLTLVSVGKLDKSWTDKDGASSQWSSGVPLAVAGFNYGLFKKRVIKDDQLSFDIEGYANTETPDYLNGSENIGGMGVISPVHLMDGTMVDAQNAMRLYSGWFGKSEYGRIAISQQPEFNFGQSWPTLVYLPIVAYMDRTQIHALMGGINRRMNEFVDEVTPHEVSHQWWGHMVGWSSYHDQWLSEGFAFFSAGLFLQMTEKTMDKYQDYWEHARKDLLDKNEYGQRTNDAGPLWLGLRLSGNHNRGAYSAVVYRKGGYVLNTLRSIMFDNRLGNQPFIDMMHDFVQQHMNRTASTESFQRIAEKHMNPFMDLDGNGKLNWFFREWVYGTAVPHYQLDYTVKEDADGKFVVDGSLTQSMVPDDFVMIVPVYADFDGTPIRLGGVKIRGNTTVNNVKVKLTRKPKRVMVNAFHDVLEQ